VEEGSVSIPPEYLNQIITGDARELAERIPDASVDLVLTDPPFGIGHKYANGFQEAKDGEPELVRWIVETSNRILKPGALAFVFQAQPKLRLTWPLFPDDSRIFIAAKNFVQLRPTPVQFAYDPVIFWQKPGKRLKAHQGRDYHISNTANTNNREMNEVGWHSCPRQLDTIRYMVSCFCPDGGIAVDFFMGSGTLAVAAKQLTRQYIGFELIPETAQRARDRVANTQAMHPVFLETQEALL
jgi:site-specific DNA-methyltransferase (adenine-specific)